MFGWRVAISMGLGIYTVFNDHNYNHNDHHHNDHNNKCLQSIQFMRILYRSSRLWLVLKQLCVLYRNDLWSHCSHGRAVSMLGWRVAIGMGLAILTMPSDHMCGVYYVLIL